VRVERRPEGFWGVGAGAGFPRQLCNERRPDRTTHVRDVLRDATRPMKKQADGSAQSSGRGAPKSTFWREEAILHRLCTESAKCAFSVAGGPGRPLLPGWRWCTRRSRTRRRRWERRRRSARASRGRLARICAPNGDFQGGPFCEVFRAARCRATTCARGRGRGVCASSRPSCTDLVRRRAIQTASVASIFVAKNRVGTISAIFGSIFAGFGPS
jgi:hypothetical protein